MAFDRPTLSEIQNRVQSDLETRLGINGRFLNSSVGKILSKVIAGAVHLLHGHLDWNYKQLFPDTAETTNLDRWADIWGVTRTVATFATGDVVFTGTTGTVIPAGTTLVRSDGVEFTTDAEATLAAGTATVAVTCSTAGATGNTDAAVILTVSSAISGLDADVTVDSGAIGGGADEETDAALRTRLLARIGDPPLGGTANDFVFWAKEVAGVTRAWAYPLYNGAGTVGVFFVRDNDGTIYPDSSEIDAVSAYIDTQRPVTSKHYVYAPTADPVNFTIQVSPDSSAIRAAIENELGDLFTRDAEPGGTIYLSRMNEAISLAEDEFDHSLVSPTANFVSTSGYLPELGTISYV